MKSGSVPTTGHLNGMGGSVIVKLETAVRRSRDDDDRRNEDDVIIIIIVEVGAAVGNMVI
jgi:hypothetical protein